MKLTECEKWVVDYLKGKDYTSPSRIGIDHARTFGFSDTHHSSWASPVCKRLVEKGVLIRNPKGHYKLTK